MVVTLVFCAGRVLHQLGYTYKGYGGHAPGFIVSLVCNRPWRELL